MTNVVIKMVLLVPVFIFGHRGGALLGHVYHGLRYGREKRQQMHGSTLQPFARIGAVLAVAGVAIYWQLTGG